MKKEFSTILFVITLLLLPFVAGIATADTVLSYTVNERGSISYDSAINTIIGENLLISLLTGTDASKNPGSIAPGITGTLSFQTGEVPADQFDLGNIGFLSNSETQTAGGFLASSMLSGELLEGMAATTYNYETPSIKFQNADISAFLNDFNGVNVPGADVISLSPVNSTLTENGFSFLSGDISLHASPLVPFPSTVLLLGAGFIGMGIVRKRLF